LARVPPETTRWIGRQTAAWLGWSMCGMSIAAASLGWLLFVASGSTADRGHGGDPIQNVAFPVFATVGALIVARQAGNAVGWLCCAVGLTSSLALNGLGFAYVHYALAGPGGGMPGGVWVAWLSEWLNDVSFGLGPLIFLLFPNGRPPSAGWRPVVWFAAIMAGLAGLLDALRPGPMVNFPFVDNPVGLPNQLALFLSNAVGLIEVLLFVIGAASVFVRFRIARGIERQQIKSFAYAASLIGVGVVPVLALPEIVTLDAQQIPPWAPLLANEYWSLAVTAIPVSIGVAILRYRLYDIDLLINRTLVYGGMTAAIVGFYVLVVGYLGLLFQTRGEVASLLAAGLAAVIFEPLRRRLQMAVNRLLYGQRDEPYVVLSRLGQRLEAALVPEAIPSTIVETVREALNLPYVALRLRSAEGEQVVAASGTPSPFAERVEVPYQQEVIGTLLLGPRGAGEAFSPADRRLLEDLALQVGVALHAIQLTTALQRARERLVATREEERRRLRRDLHDGLGPQLASQTLGLDAARTLLRQDPEAADTLLATLREHTQTAVADIRRLVYELRPPALDDLGLVAALRQHAAPYAQAGLQVVLDAPDPLPALPAAVELAAYRIAQEALTNVARHAQARTCFMRLHADRGIGRLCLEVSDDGRGLPADVRSGVGLISMRERATELGGRCAIESGPQGGTRVWAELPIPKESAWNG
jgi:two-component system NarL family sensor kinase